MKHLDLKSIIRLIIIIFFPFFILIVVGLVVIPNKIDYLKEVIAFGMLSFLFFTLYLIINNSKIRRYYLLFTYLVLSFFLIIKLSFYYNFKAKLSSSVLYLMFETNKTEASEFLSNYIDYKLIFLYIFILISFIYLVKIIFSKSAKKKYISKILNIDFKYKIIKLFGLFLIFITGYLIQWKLADENILIKSINSYTEYSEFKKRFKEILSLNTNRNIKVTQSSNEAQTYVVIIGESTSNWHMQLYGYHRNTNPLLSEIKDELLIFDDVITPNVHTIVALEKIMTLIDYKNQKEKIKNASIIQLANQAGFTTYWLSNQRPVGFHESVPSLIGTAANNKHFLNTEDYDAIAYDEILLPTLEHILTNKKKKKIIFLHLMGTHVQYENRYPNSFNYFNDNDVQTKYKTKKSIALINQYDNAVRYNDSIVRNIIEKVRVKNLNSFVLYFSDHGDELFDTFNFTGHNSHYSTKPMHEIPFILWMSDKYKLNRNDILSIDSITKRSYILEDFFHSFSDLTNIKFEQYNKEKSIFNIHFKAKTRLIKNGIDYDKKN